MTLSALTPPISVTLRNCAKTFDKRVVLHPVDLTVAAGETVVLLGPSGCGKTTTLRMIAGLATPDAGGAVLFDDRDVTRVPIEQRDVGMVFQSYALFPHLSVRDNIAYGLRIRKMPRDVVAARVAAMLQLTSLEAHADKSIDALSGGQRQRVALARALAPQPRILLLDEPLTALDAQLRETLRAEMNALLRGLGVTTIYVTHDQNEAMALADKIVVMSAGRIEQVGAPRDIYHRPATRHVAEFVGTINRLRGECRADGLAVNGRILPLRRGSNTAKGDARITDSSWVDAYFRPEDVEVTEADRGDLAGVVRTSTFLGDRTRLEIDDAGTIDTLAHDATPRPRPWIADVPGRTVLARGSRLGLVLRDDALMLLD